MLGGSGFIGKNLIPQLLRNPDSQVVIFDALQPQDVPFMDDDRVSFIGGEFRTGFDFDSLIRHCDMVIHLISTSVPVSETSARSEIENNLLPSMELFEASVRQNVKKVVFLSSGGTVYGFHGIRSNQEDDLPDPINTYGLQKVMIEQALRLIARNSHTDYRIIRLANPYGPGQNPHGPLGLITKLVYQIMRGNPITIYGDGSVVRDFIYIDDTIQCILNIISHGAHRSIYNVGTGVGTSVADVVTTIQQTLPESPTILHREGRAVDVPYSVLDISKYLTLAPSTKFITLQEGIKRTYEYFKEQEQ